MEATELKEGDWVHTYKHDYQGNRTEPMIGYIWKISISHYDHCGDSYTFVIHDHNNYRVTCNVGEIERFATPEEVMLWKLSN